LPTIEELFPPGDKGTLDGRVIVTACGEANPQGTDCASDGGYIISGGKGTRTACTGGKLDLQATYPIGGIAGAKYTVTMHFYGIMEPNDYGQSADRDAAPGRPGNQNDGADPIPWAEAPPKHTYTFDDYNSYEIHIDDQNNQEVAVYYLNADTSQGHWTYVIDYEKKFPVIGGGRLRTRVYDTNCRQIKNCGPNGTPASNCAAQANARRLTLTGVDPMPAAVEASQGGLLQPNLIGSRDASSAGQWWLVDIKSVDSVEMP
jgi:hypothetical protein